jgi:DNA mismatch endonuclease, patch repair protein
MPENPHSTRMKRVPQRDTSTEIHLRRALWKNGLRYRKQRKVAGTTPDIAFVGAKVAVFVDGCYWHGCPQHYVAPKSNRDFWKNRLAQNQNRDARDTLRLQAAGWRVLRFWECEVLRQTDEVVARVKEAVS